MGGDPAVLCSDKIQMKVMKVGAAWERTALDFLEQQLFVRCKEIFGFLVFFFFKNSAV